MKQVAEPDDPLIVCGDFNVEPGGETFAVLAKIGLTDLVTNKGFEGTRSSYNRKPGKFADYYVVCWSVDLYSRKDLIQFFSRRPYTWTIPG